VGGCGTGCDALRFWCVVYVQIGWALPTLYRTFSYVTPAALLRYWALNLVIGCKPCSGGHATGSTAYHRLGNLHRCSEVWHQASSRSRRESKVCIKGCIYCSWCLEYRPASGVWPVRRLTRSDTFVSAKRVIALGRADICACTDYWKYINRKQVLKMEDATPPPVIPKKQQTLTGAQKRKLCELYEGEPGVYTQKKLIEAAKKEFGICPSNSQVQRIINERDKWLTLDELAASKIRQRGPKWGELEDGVFQWFLQVCTISRPNTPELWSKARLLICHAPLKCRAKPDKQHVGNIVHQESVSILWQALIVDKVQREPNSWT
jgi:hypothetical protein